MSEMTRQTARLPHAVVRLAPLLPDMADKLELQGPAAFSRGYRSNMHKTTLTRRRGRKRKAWVFTPIRAIHRGYGGPNGAGTPADSCRAARKTPLKSARTTITAGRASITLAKSTALKPLRPKALATSAARCLHPAGRALNDHHRISSLRKCQHGSFYGQEWSSGHGKSHRCPFDDRYARYARRGRNPLAPGTRTSRTTRGIFAGRGICAGSKRHGRKRRLSRGRAQL